MSNLRKALLLDALGTLVRLESPAPLLRAELAARFGIETTEEQAAAALGAEIRYYRAHLQDGSDARGLADLRRRCAEALRAALPPSPRLAEIGGDQLLAALLASLQFTAFEDAHDAITAAREREMRIVVASNWDVSLHEVLSRLGLASIVDGVLTSAEVGIRKPAPALFEAALRLADVDPSEAIHVGDSVEEDVIGAQRSGIEPVLLSRDGRSAPPGVRQIGSLSELSGLLP